MTRIAPATLLELRARRFDALSCALARAGRAILLRLRSHASVALPHRPETQQHDLTAPPICLQPH
ncbi:hypothetical protein [Roseobacter sinensis]|uniref:Uncharacterized protein n=1 Tax=Roseobacter sinensis TaxID=2931391 RepID=A0ABT3BE32_9RHOB|nr:hypothetical protein [Roseobacter sp. WL0113]MCV3271837.1 hypothetical protein [Roseobacter sp. WL0113]